MFSQLLILVAVLLIQTSFNPVQQVSGPYDQTQAQTVRQPDGLYYLSVSGASSGAICSLGNCNQGFATPRDAVNYWSGLLSQYYHIQIVPLPPPPGG
jgi:hypothetical protein